MENRKVERSFLIFTLKDFRDRYVGTLREVSRVVYSQYRGTAPVYSGYAPPEPMIYCPVCRVEYPQSQTDNHILKHTIQNVRFAEKKEEEVVVSTQHSKNSFIYPMVEPLEFSTS